MEESTELSIDSFNRARVNLLKPALFLTLLFWAALSMAQSNGFTNYFNHDNGTTYTKSLATQDMGSVEYWNNTWNSDIQDNNLRIRFAQGDYGTNAGIISRTRMSGDRTYSVEYRLKFDNGFDFRLGGKIPGLAGGSAPSGGGRPTDGNGFSTRFMWRAGGKLVVYAYYRDQVNYYGDDWETGVYMNPGDWYTIKEEVTVNTGGNYNGTVKVWVNGVERINRTGLRLMTNNNTVDVMYMDTFMGGNDASWSPDHTQYLRMDNFVCVKGGDSGAGSPPPPPAANDGLSSITGPDVVTQGETVNVTVNYEASTSRDIVVSFKEDNGNYTKYGNDIRVNVGTGSGSIDISVPIDASAPVANDQYQYQAYITEVGKGWDDRKATAYKTNVDVIAPVVTYTDQISSVSGPEALNQGETVEVAVNYEASTSRDIVVSFKEDNGNYTKYSNDVRVSVGAGNGSVNVSVPTFENTPAANDNYQYQVYMTTSGGGWNDQTAIAYQTNIDVNEAPAPASGGGDGNITVTAYGQCGAETIELWVNGSAVQTWNNISTSESAYSYNGYSGGTVAVHFVNDGNDGCDRNVFINYIDVCGTRLETESSATRTGCGDGQWLWCDGNFDFGDVGCGSTGGSSGNNGGSSGGGNGTLVDGGIYRIKNAWGGVYLHANGDTDGSSVVLKNLETGWWTQQWIVENVSGNTYRMKCRWGETYLSETSTYSNVELKTSAVTSTSFEVEEVAGEANTFRLKGNSGDYLHANGSADGSSITTFPLEATWGSQKWVLEYDANARKVETTELSSAAVIYPTVIALGGQLTLVSNIDGATANVFNMSGQQVLSNNKDLNLLKGENKINLSGLERGLYFVKTSFSNEVLRFAIR